MGTEHSGGLLCQMLGRLPEERMASGGLAELWGEKLKTGIKIVQSSLKSGFVFLQGMHLPGKTYLAELCQMSNCDISSGFGAVEWHSRWLLFFTIFLPLCLPGRVSIFQNVFEECSVHYIVWKVTLGS